ncbi:MAG: chemotaxis protein CheW [Candidatus Omnitrophica bacterium]|nr:chemotaxis protein CheW [Candidatus Omnitrophota bacterium]
MATDKAKEYQLVVFTIGDEEFGVDITQVREIVRLVQITYLPKAASFIEGVVNLRGQILAVIDLSKRLGIGSKPRGERTRIIVVEVGENIVGMIVDSVSEVLRLASDSIEEVPSLIDTEVPEHYIRGVGKLKDRLLVLLDLTRILTMEEIKHVEYHVKSISENAKDSKTQ